MTNRYNAIIIGAGHNGLVAAAYLAKRGKKVLPNRSATGLPSTRFRRADVCARTSSKI